jgi:hypothetical protein
MNSIDEIRRNMGDEWIPQIYEDRVRPERTRSFDLPFSPRENSPVIMQTLLGVEIKAGPKRILCPDLSTANYLSVFARIGCEKIAVPYDITIIPVLAERLQMAWNKTITLLNQTTAELSPQASGRVRAILIRTMRDELATIGAGDLMPLFNTSTKQRDGR